MNEENIKLKGEIAEKDKKVEMAIKKSNLIKSIEEFKEFERSNQNSGKGFDLVDLNDKSVERLKNDFNVIFEKNEESHFKDFLLSKVQLKKNEALKQFNMRNSDNSKEIKFENQNKEKDMPFSQKYRTFKKKEIIQTFK